MQKVYIFIIQNDVWIYILCAFGLFWYLTQFWRARSTLRQAMFGLERERGTRTRGNALFFIALLGSVIAAVFYVNLYIAPTIPLEALKPPTPTPDFRVTPLTPPTPLSTAVPPSPTLIFAATATLPGQGEPGGGDAGDLPATDETPSPPAVTPTPFISCKSELNFTQPKDGSVISGPITFFGTTNTENFGNYSLEANGPETGGQWASLLGRKIDQQVIDSFLGNADLSEWSSGPYLIRLTAVDADDNLTGYCVIQVTIAE